MGKLYLFRYAIINTPKTRSYSFITRCTELNGRFRSCYIYPLWEYDKIGEPYYLEIWIQFYKKWVMGYSQKYLN